MPIEFKQYTRISPLTLGPFPPYTEGKGSCVDPPVLPPFMGEGGLKGRKGAQHLWNSTPFLTA